MELNNEFRVGVPPSRAWAVLTDVERIAPCMPGAQLEEIEGDEYRGVVKVKVGPITAKYKGKATFLEQDETAGRAVLRAEGRDTRGQGNANATITATLTPDGDGTKVVVATDLTITGKVAQFGRGVLADVSAKLLGQFVDCLEANVLGEAPGGGGGPEASQASTPAELAPSAQPQPAPSAQPQGAPVASVASVAPSPSPGPGVEADGATGVRRINAPEATPVNLIEAVRTPVAKRAVPAFIGALVILFVVLRLRRRKGGKKA
jgi:carbon monoxide dehydrogenase subunit G